MLPPPRFPRLLAHAEKAEKFTHGNEEGGEAAIQGSEKGGKLRVRRGWKRLP